jgi:hypothetical protein
MEIALPDRLHSHQHRALDDAVWRAILLAHQAFYALQAAIHTVSQHVVPEVPTGVGSPAILTRGAKRPASSPGKSPALPCGRPDDRRR